MSDVMRNLNIYLLSVHLSNANYEQDTGLVIVESHVLKSLLLSFLLFTLSKYPLQPPRHLKSASVLSPVSKQKGAFMLS